MKWGIAENDFGVQNVQDQCQPYLTSPRHLQGNQKCYQADQVTGVSQIGDSR